MCTKDRLWSIGSKMRHCQVLVEVVLGQDRLAGKILIDPLGYSFGRLISKNIPTRVSWRSLQKGRHGKSYISLPWSSSSHPVSPRQVFISRGLQLEGQVVTEEQDLQVMVMMSQKNSPVQYVHASAMQHRVRAAVAQSQASTAQHTSTS